GEDPLTFPARAQLAVGSRFRSGRWHGSRRSMLVLRNAVGDVVVVAFIGDMDVDSDLGVGRLVEGAHGEADPVFVDRVPEERGAAGGAEAAAYFFGRLEPGDVVGAVEGDGDLEAHGAAEAGSFVHGALLCG